VTSEQNKFLQTIALPAICTMRITGVPASVTMAQAIIESSNNNGWGKSRLALEANNYFGIKDTDFCEGYVELSTTEYVHGIPDHVMARFEKYPTIEKSFEHHGLLISKSKRYAPAMAVASDPDKFAHALQTCGYSTNPNYGDLLMQLVRRYDLTQYDIQPPEHPAGAKEAAA
jgi:flagellum-specific peptidoglycan hydrolase FlgJ